MSRVAKNFRRLISRWLFEGDQNNSSTLPVTHSDQTSAAPSSPPPAYCSRNGSPTASEQDSITTPPPHDDGCSFGGSLCKTHGGEGQIDKKPDPEKSNDTKNSVKEKPAKPVFVSGWQTTQRLPERNRIRQLLTALVLAILIFCILFPILWIEHHHNGSHGETTTNSTSTTTVTNSHIITKTDSTTIIVMKPTTKATISTLTVFETSTVDPTTFTTTPTPKPTKIGGFAAVDFTDDEVEMFWADGQGNIQVLSQDVYGQDPWQSDGSVCGKARVGTAVSFAYASYVDYNSEHLIYADEDYMIQGCVSDDDVFSVDSDLAALGLKTSESMNFMLCAPYRPSDDPGSLSDLYLFYNSSDGYVKVTQWTNQQWHISPDTPFSRGASFVGCDNDYYNNLIAYVINEDGQLEQWSLNRNLTSPWTRGFQYSGDFHPQTLIYSVTASENPNGRSHVFLQDANNMLLRLDTHGFGVDTTIVGRAEIGVAVPGTRMTTSGNCNTTVTIFYQANDTDQISVSMTDSWWNNTVYMDPAGGVVVVDQLPFGAARRVGAELPLKLLLCFVGVVIGLLRL